VPETTPFLHVVTP